MTDAHGFNQFVDTRGVCTEPVPFTTALINGLAPGGGLYVPREVPSLTLNEILSLAERPYAERAAYIYKRFEVDLPDDVVDACMGKSYGANFDTPEICPITSLDDDFCILVATSGDTGKAALEGFKGIDGVSIGVLFPDGGVSDIQRKQMVTTTGSNVYVWAVRGNFDDCQTAAKRVFSDDDYAEELLRDFDVALSSANSINWGRLLPQVVYYISSYAELCKQGKVVAGKPIDVCVPTGNFGNILAAWYAKQMGTPIDALFCASNENRVLTDFIESGTYDIKEREFILTPSPSMDILVSSNLERLLYLLSDTNGDAIRNWMEDLNVMRAFTVSEEVASKLKLQFSGASVSNEECLATIKEVFDAHDYLIDPHTAVAYAAAMRLRKDNPVLVACTAHWAKFGNNVYRALHGLRPDEALPPAVESLTGCQLNDLIAEETGKHDIPAGLAGLDEMTPRFKDVIDGDVPSVEKALTAFLDTQRV